MSHRRKVSKSEEEKEKKKKEEEKAKRQKEKEKRRSDIADRLRTELGEKGFFLPSSAFRRELQERTRAIRVLALQDDSSSDEEGEEEAFQAEAQSTAKKLVEDSLLKKGGAGGSRGKRDMSKVASLMMLRHRTQLPTKLDEESPVLNSPPLSYLPPPDFDIVDVNG